MSSLRHTGLLNPQPDLLSQADVKTGCRQVNTLLNRSGQAPLCYRSAGPWCTLIRRIKPEKMHAKTQYLILIYIME